MHLNFTFGLALAYLAEWDQPCRRQRPPTSPITSRQDMCCGTSTQHVLRLNVALLPVRAPPVWNNLSVTTGQFKRQRKTFMLGI